MPTVWESWCQETSASTTSAWVAWNTDEGTYTWTGTTAATGTSCSQTAGTYTVNMTDAVWVSWSEEVVQRQEQRERLDDVGNRQDAERIAWDLLVAHLNTEQKKTLKKNESFLVEVNSGNRYRIRRGRTANVDVLNWDGSVKHKLCFHPNIDCPSGDTMLSQKLMLEHCEEEVLRIANVH